MAKDGRGRKPKPTKLKELAGNPGKRDLNTNEPQPSDTGHAAPACISNDALPIWNRIAPELHNLGLLTSLDHDTLLVYCEAVAAFIEATRMIGETGYTYETDNYKTVSPWVNIQNKASATMAKYGTRFGFSPSDRTGLVSTIKAEGKAGDITNPDSLFGQQEVAQ